jgi:membrane protein
MVLGLRQRLGNAGRLVRGAASEWSDDQATMQSAALAYYTIFSIAPLLIISIAVAGLVFGEEATRGQIFATLSGFLGEEGARGVEAMVRSSSEQRSSGIIATVVGLFTLVLGATGAFAQLQQSLNLIWKVQPRKEFGFRSVLRQRLLSFSMVLVIAFLLLVSLIASAGLSAVGRFVGERLPGGEVIWQVVNFGVSFGMVTLLFAAIYKVLPDVELKWGDTWIGAAVTAFLFAMGKLGIGTYLGKSGVASTYGAAASVVIMLLWVYYSSCILYFGAEFTRAYATRGGRKVLPKSEAERVGLRGMEPVSLTKPGDPGRRDTAA